MIAESEILRLRNGYPQVNKALDVIKEPVIHKVITPPAVNPLPADEPAPAAAEQSNNDIVIGVI